jgi:OmpA-OmpF porin, OOP family
LSGQTSGSKIHDGESFDGLAQWCGPEQEILESGSSDKRVSAYHVRDERKIMKIQQALPRTLVVLLSLAAIGLLCGMAAAQADQAQGVIDGRTGATMSMKTASGNVVVLLTDDTQVDDVEGSLHLRKKQMGLTALIPGLPVQVKGSYNAKHQLVADSVRFKSSDLKNAQDIQAGVTPAEQQIKAEQQQTAVQQAAIREQEQQIEAEQQKTAANKAAIAAANKRFGELGQYNILGEVTVLFANGKVTLEPQYKPQLLQLAQQAQTITGYVILVKGYASSVGSAALNQKLSTERADNVADFLEQQGHIPLTNMLAPGAMGTSKQVAPDDSAEGQAENRRVVVSILQNKGIAGE